MTIEQRFLASPHRTLLGLSLPVMLSLIVEPLAGVVDTAFVERLGAEHAAALGAATAVLSSVLWVFNFLGVGTQTRVAYSVGERDPRAARRAIGLAIALSGLLGIGVAVVLWWAAGPLVRWMSSNVLVQENAIRYLQIRLFGAPAGLVLLTCFGALRGRTDMRTPLHIAFGVSVANVVLDALLIFGAGPLPPLGIAGAAWGTILSQCGGACVAGYVVARSVGITWPESLRGSGELLLVGRDMVMRTGALLLFMLVSTRAALSLGVDEGAAHQAIRQLWILTAFALDAFAASSQSLVGTFMGSGRPDRACRVSRVACAWGLGAGALLCLLLILFENTVVLLMVPESARDVFHTAWIVCALAQPLNSLAFVTDGIHMGTADFAYLRNAMLASTALGIFAIAAIGPAGTLGDVWWATALWIASRAALGVVRIWPGVGRAPLGASKRTTLAQSPP